MAETKPLAANIKKAVDHVLTAAGEPGKLYRSDIHRSVVTRVIMDVLIDDGAVEENDRGEYSMLVYSAMAAEASLLEHSNFKQARLAALGLIPKAADKPAGTGLIV